MNIKKIKFGILGELVLAGILVLVMVVTHKMDQDREMASVPASIEVNSQEGEKSFIKWVDFNVSYDALCKAYELDVATYGQEIHLNWIDLLAYAATKGGGEFNKSSLKEIDALKEKLCNKEATMDELTKDMKYYSYYKEAYEAVLGGYVGEYELEIGEENGQKQFEKRYGLKAFSPIAKNFPYSDYDDFGSPRSYGYKREHLGHDMMGQIGTPIVSVESGYVEALGWNMYGGWRIGIRSFDGKRYYYYAHLRQNYPYQEGLEVGSLVSAGDIIGYMGHTGYSTKENTNNIDSVHLHYGIQLIFDESQKEGNGEIWIDCYALTRFLTKNRSEAAKVEGTKEWKRILEIRLPEVEEQKALLEQSGGDKEKAKKSQEGLENKTDDKTDDKEDS